MSEVKSHARLQALFLAALERSGQERVAFLDQACAGDPVLRKEIERLIAADAQPGGALGTAADSPGALLRDSSACERVLAEAGVRATGLRDETVPFFLPSEIGHYAIRGVLGEGGMGIVYLAEQRNPRRTVALKVIRPGVTSPRMLRRLEHEAQVLGRLQHPGIAQIFEADTLQHADGPQPFFAMELVDGVPLTEYATRRALDVRARVELLVKLCRAVHHAHQRGVIHRDLKPANVLVDAAGQPKVLDFGIARLVEESAAPEALLTLTGQLVGTLPYMSPEQFSGDPRQIDVRADVYSLGAIAYELLGERLPHDVAGRPVHEVARIVCEERARLLGAIDSRLGGDLETVVAKALEADKECRYASALEFEADLERCLAEEPILARPPSTAYQFRKFARRNKLLVGSGAAFVLLLVTGVAILSSLLLESQRQNAEIQRRSLFYRITDLRQRADDLWPAEPARIRAYERWLEQAEVLRQREPIQQELDDLHHRSLSRPANGGAGAILDPEVATVIYSERMRLAELDRMLGHLREWGSDKVPDLEPEEGAELNGMITTLLQRELSRRETGIDRLIEKEREETACQFADVEDKILHDRLVALLAEQDSLADPQCGLEAGKYPHPVHGWSIRKRLEWARSVEDRTVTGEEAASFWTKAMASIGDPEECPPYGGLSIRPQLGLLPIGRDPHSRLWEFVHLQSGNPPERNPDGSLLITAETGIILVLIPGGSFWFGAQSQDREGPNYDPHVDRDLELREETVQPFFLSKYEMTQGQWLRATGNNPSLVWAGSIKGGNMTTLLHPVESVTLSECSRVLGRFGLRLPDDVQWDRAARGGVEQDWWVEVVREQRTDLGNLADLAYGRYASNEPYDSWFDDGFALHAPVGRFLPNPYGLCDVVGNVYEWIQSTSQLGISGDVADRSGADRTALMKTPTFYRGGAFINQASIVGIGAGGSFSPETREYWLGVRPARLLDQ